MKKRIISLALALLLVISFAPTAFAAGPEVITHNGLPTAFLTAFGKFSYGGQMRTTYRKFADAYSALGSAGGRIVASGTVDMKDFSDSTGRGKLYFEGVGDKITETTLKFPDTVERVDFHGDVSFDNLVIKIPENVPLFTNGHAFSVSENFNCYYSEQHNKDNIWIKYESPLVIATGDLAGRTADKISLDSGNYLAVVGGAAFGSASANTKIQISGGVYENIFGGNYNTTGAFSGSSEIVISGGEIKNLFLGGDSGTFNGNMLVDLSGGTVGNLSVGSEGGAKINGNVALRVTGESKYTLNSENADTISGKIVFIADSASFAALSTGKYDYLIDEGNATVTPVYDGTRFLGFNIADSNGLIPAHVYADGKEIFHKNGIFTLPEGKTVISCESAKSVVSVDKAASYVAGYEDGSFRPQNNMTRAEAITLLSRIITPDITKLSSVAVCDYSDVTSSDWYAGVIGFFQKLGYLEKLETDGGTKISPNAQITRAEFSELCVKVVSLIYNGREFGVKIFPDVPSTNEYISSIGQLGYLGVIGGYEDGSFRPGNNITRAEVVTIVNRFLGRTPTGNAGSISFADSVGHWAQPQIITACNPAVSAGVTVWTVTDDVTGGSYTLTGAPNVGMEISALYDGYKNGTVAGKDAVDAIDKITRKQIETIKNSVSSYSGRGTVYYISNNGNDANDGKSPATAWQTLTRLKAANLMYDDVVLLERGGTFRGTINVISGVTYSSYGEGPKPIVTGSLQNYADPSLWVETRTPNVYRFNGLLPNVAIVSFNDTGIEGNYNEKIGMPKVVGRDGFRNVGDFQNDLEFYSDLKSQSFYMYSLYGNPGERFESIEMGHDFNLIGGDDVYDVVIDNIRGRHTSRHCFTFGGDIKNVTIRNCISDYVGGTIARGHLGSDIHGLGNAFQLYGGCDGFYLFNNWAYQIFDTAFTHQYAGTSNRDCHMNNVQYIGNVAEYCHWAIEYYNYVYNNHKASFRNTLIKDNISRLTGYGWGSHYRVNWASSLVSWGLTKDTENFVIENNIFDRCADAVIEIDGDGNKMLELRRNIFVQNYGGLMGETFSSAWYADLNVPESMRDAVGDTTSIVIFNNDAPKHNFRRI